MKKLLVALMLAALAPSVYAGNSAGKVNSFLVTRYGNLFFKAGVPQSAPACSVAGEYAVSLVGTDGPAGKAILAAIMAAHAGGENVYVIGNGKCDVAGDRETVEYVVIE